MTDYTDFDPGHRPHDLKTVVRWGIVDRLTGARKIAPPGPGAPRVEPDLERIHRPTETPRLTWVGHASFLGSQGSQHFLIDPNFSRRLGAFYRRHVPPGLEIHELPSIDLVLITHSHPDHHDAPSIRELDRATPIVAPAGLGRWFSRRGFTRVHELTWWQSLEIGGLEVTFTPARHWSRRTPWDGNRSLWGGYVIQGGGSAVYHAGDSAWFDGFREIGRRFPDLEAAMLPIGAYRPAWFMEHSHMNPEQAGRAFLDVGARRFVPMHWGTFQLTDESLAEPAERIRKWWDGQELPDKEIHLLAVGETLELGCRQRRRGDS